MEIFSIFIIYSRAMTVTVSIRQLSGPASEFNVPVELFDITFNKFTACYNFPSRKDCRKVLFRKI